MNRNLRCDANEFGESPNRRRVSPMTGINLGFDPGGRPDFLPLVLRHVKALFAQG